MAAALQAEQRRQLKLAKRAEFDAKHAAGRGGGGGPVDEEPPAKAARTAGGRPAADTEPSFFDAVKAQLAAKSAMTGQALAALNPAAALAMQGYRAGSYVRMRLSGTWRLRCEPAAHCHSSTVCRSFLHCAACASRRPGRRLPRVDWRLLRRRAL